MSDLLERVKGLIAGLKDVYWSVRCGSLPQALARIGPEPGRPCRPSSRRERLDPECPYASAEALGRYRGQEAIPALIEALKNKNVDVRLESVKALARIGPAAKEAVPAIKCGAQGQSGRCPILVRLGAPGCMGPEAKGGRAGPHRGARGQGREGSTGKRTSDSSHPWLG